MTTSVEAAMESLRQIKSTEPPLWLVPKQELSQAVRLASQHLFSILKPHAPKSPFDQLLIEGFDAEQIWQQIDLQSQPLRSTLRCEVKKFEKHPEEISKLKEALEGGHKKVLAENETDDFDDDEDSEDDDDLDMDEDEDDDNNEEEEEGDDEEMEEENAREGEDKGGIEDKFLKIKELQDYLEEDEAREFGLKEKNKKERKTKNDDDDSELEDDDDDEEGEKDDDNDEAEEEEDELGLFKGDDEDDEAGNARF